jgi:hypothetical protein
MTKLAQNSSLKNPLPPDRTSRIVINDDENRLKPFELLKFKDVVKVRNINKKK